jgi:hypothetical protein
LASFVRARVAKMSRISSARSITATPMACSTFFPCAGLSSSSKRTERRVERARLLAQLVELPLAQVRGRVRAVELLGERADRRRRRPCRPAGELLEVLLDRGGGRRSA